MNAVLGKDTQKTGHVRQRGTHDNEEGWYCNVPSVVAVPQCFMSTSALTTHMCQGPSNTYLIVGKDPEDVQLCIWGKSLALPHAGNHTGDKCAMAQPCSHKKGSPMRQLRMHNEVEHSKPRTMHSWSWTQAASAVVCPHTPDTTVPALLCATPQATFLSMYLLLPASTSPHHLRGSAKLLSTWACLCNHRVTHKYFLQTQEPCPHLTGTYHHPGSAHWSSWFSPSHS